MRVSSESVERGREGGRERRREGGKGGSVREGERRKGGTIEGRGGACRKEKGR